ncbi:sodium channel subunit beta-1-like [Cyprinus carpio]|uniref:Sodium channel regulatory subunit beta-3 n=1 Tax=Cyprinus carpio TaxID=7962 RepID=A0A9Q9XHJ4_CYPCA|nr:sodium channel subunit beta-1-like [Cyprinus carpio]
MMMMMMMKMMMMRRLLLLCVFCALSVSLCSGACAEVDSDTEAVAGQLFKLGCISCKMRGEVEASATVDWMFRARGEADFVHIYSYDGEASSIIDERFQDRMEWHGSKKTFDLQDASVDLLNVTFKRTPASTAASSTEVLSYEHYEFSTIASQRR